VCGACKKSFKSKELLRCHICLSSLLQSV